jgi:hypothetical protein
LDFIAVVGFLIGVVNYEENVDQTTIQDTVQKAVNLINMHLEEQDNKIDKIIEMLGGVESNER